MKTTLAKQKKEESVGVIHVYSYKLLNEHIKFLYPKLKPLEKSIKHSMMPIPFEVYVSSMVFFSLIAGICGGIIGIIVSQFVSIQPVIIEYLLPPIAGMVLMLMTFGILQIIPIARVKNRATKLLEEIPHFIGYMSTLATSGLSLEEIFKAIAKEETDEDIVKDARFITRNIEILGMDLITAVKDLINRTPPGPYSELLEGAIITSQSGGDLKEYFNATAKVQLEEKKMLLQKTTESLGSVAEIYTILLIVFPLLAVIMLSIMGIMSPSLGGFDLLTLMNILTFAVIPLSGVLMLVMMDTMVPKR
ncbi:Flp pilus assembly protein TadC [Candidatus Nitrosarchaeum limnium SFB1]|jgi:flagellar protein FlaJ|uniref:Flp pilus assembly protein TadC n=1 Tax=Candidatus Nitrosarchaeum limnium SFB1 TaxID=886738 RepID=F3KJG5_9ARCH|nr:Flp pilus assembly protein TadC [Candidatus Nitrosarchaeum limnium SFB1]